MVILFLNAQTEFISSMFAKKSSNALTQGRVKRALQVGSLAVSVSSSYALNALKQPVRSADEKEPDLFTTREVRARVAGDLQFR